MSDVIVPPDSAVPEIKTVDDSAPNHNENLIHDVPLFDAAITDIGEHSEPTSTAPEQPAAEPPKRGRGRPRKNPAPEVAQATATVSADAAAGAALIMQSLDTVCATVGGDIVLTKDEAQARAVQRHITMQAWEAYLAENGVKLPPWMLVLAMTGVYVAPAFRTPSAKEKLSVGWQRIKNWWKNRKTREV